VRHVRFEGNETIRGRVLRHWMKLQPSHWWSKARYHAAVFNADVRRIQLYYLGEGFLQAETYGSVDSLHAKPGKVDLTVLIRERDQWMLRSLELRVPEEAAAARDTLLGLLRAIPPGPYRPNGIIEDQDRLLSALVRRGYVDARVRIEVNRCDSLRRADLRYYVEPGERSRVRRVQINGLYKTREKVVLRELTLKEGDVLLPRQALKSRSNLLGLGIFSDVAIRPSPADSGKVWKTLVVTVRPRQGGSLGGGVGYGTYDHLRVLSSVEQQNLFGRAIQGALRLRYGQRRRGAEADLTLPWTLGHRFSSHFDVEHQWVSPRSYRAEKTRGGISFLRPLGFVWKADLGYRVERFVLLRSRAGAQPPGRTRLGQIEAGITRDTRDDLIRPHTGSYLRFSQDWASPRIGSQFHYGRSEIRHVRIRTIRSVTFASRLQAGLLEPHDLWREVPVPERFFAGGDLTVRGFPEDAVGPVDSLGVPQGARVLTSAAVEARVPSSGRFGLSLFLDTAELVDDPHDLELANASVGAGFGFRFDGPVGRVRLDFGFPLTRRFSKGAQVYLGSGAAF
jgi:outer membrane protein insertion porin family